MKVIAPMPRFRFKHLTWVSGRRDCSEKEIEVIKTIDPKFPMKLADGTVLNPPPVKEEIVMKPKLKTKPKKQGSELKTLKPKKENEDESSNEDRPKGDSEVQGEEL